MREIIKEKGIEEAMKKLMRRIRQKRIEGGNEDKKEGGIKA